ncbi:MAG: hypothetical protein U5K31_02575 [Balneolaceae bacterium]|nr:hypothetical protein [Balneolaceae bacterium]
MLADIARAIELRWENQPFVYGRIEVVHPETGSQIAARGEPWEQMRRERDGLKPAVSSNAATFYHRSLFEGGARFDTSYRIAADYKFVLRALQETGGKQLYVDRLVAIMRGGGVSSRVGTLKFREEVRMLRELDVPIPPLRRLYMGLRAYGLTFLHGVVGERMFARLAYLWQRLKNRNAHSEANR